LTENPDSDNPKESPRTNLFQFVVFPLGVVVIAVVIFLLFGQLASEQHSIPEYLSDIRTGGTYDLTTLPVALRELRNLLQAAAAVADSAQRA
jgi:hypothetical protein